MRQSRYQKALIPASGAVASWLGSQELAQALRPHMAKVKWEAVVGTQVASVTQVEAVRDGVLFVRVKNSVWANELTLLKDDMVRRLNLTLGGRVITDIHFKGGGLRRGLKPPERVVVEPPSDAELVRVSLGPEVWARVTATVQGIKDDRFRERIQASLLRVARLEAWKRQHGWLPCSGCQTLVAPVPADEPLCDLCRAGVGSNTQPWLWER